MNNNSQAYKEMIMLKGIGNQLSNLSYPRISNLQEMLGVMGYTVIPLTQTMKATSGTTISTTQSREKVLLND